MPNAIFIIHKQEMQLFKDLIYRIMTLDFYGRNYAQSRPSGIPGT